MTPQPKRTRASVVRDMVKICLAEPESGSLIAEVIEENKIDLPDVDWNLVSAHWLIAMVGPQSIGCVLVLPAKPFGFIEFLLVKPSFHFKLRAVALRKLSIQAIATLQMYGSDYLFGTSLEKKFADVMKKNGMVKAAPGDLMVKRL